MSQTAKKMLAALGKLQQEYIQSGQMTKASKINTITKTLAGDSVMLEKLAKIIMES